MDHLFERRPATRSATRDPLTLGLRALTLLARRGPMDLPRFARSVRLTPRQAALLIAIFEGDGLVRREPGAAEFVATPLARALIGPVPLARADLH